MATTPTSTTRQELDELLDRRELLWSQGRDREADRLTAPIVRLVRALDAKAVGVTS